MAQAMIPNFRVAISDVLMAGVTVVVLLDPLLRIRLLRVPGPLRVALLFLVIAIVDGLVVDQVRFGGIIREAWLNKGAGSLLLLMIAGTVVALCTTHAAVTRLLRWFLIGAAATTAISMALWAVYWTGRADVGAVWAFGAFGARFTGFLLSPNAAAIYLAAALLVTLAATTSATLGVGPSWLRIAFVALLTIGLVASVSRSTWLAAVPALVLATVLLPRRRLIGALAAACVAIPLLSAVPAAVGPSLAQVLNGNVSFLRRDEGTGYTPSPAPATVAPAATAPVASGSPLATTPLPAESGSPLATTPPPAASGSPFATTKPTSAPATTRPPLITTSPPTPTQTVVPRGNPNQFLDNVSGAASDHYGLNDRIIISLEAIRLWRSDLTSLVFGLGLEGFAQLSTANTVIGDEASIHSTYVRLPAEMGLPGLAALVAIVGALFTLTREVWRRESRPLAVACVSVLALYGTWWLLDDGLWQRVLWMTVGVVAALVAIGRRETAP